MTKEEENLAVPSVRGGDSSQCLRTKSTRRLPLGPLSLILVEVEIDRSNTGRLLELWDLLGGSLEAGILHCRRKISRSTTPLRGCEDGAEGLNVVKLC